MKRYTYFLRSSATVSLVILYSLTTFFSFSFAAAEEHARVDEQVDEVLKETTSPNLHIEKTIASEIQVSEAIEPELAPIQDTPEMVEIVGDEQEGAETIVFQNSVMACDVANSPVITFEAYYADQQPGGVYSLVSILAQIGASATDLQDGVVVVENNLSSLFPFTSGWHEVTFTAQDADGCITEETIDIFIFGNDFVPVCTPEDVYLRFSFPEEYTGALGTNSEILSGQWFPVLYGGGVTLLENKNNITVAHDISIVRNGDFVYIDVGPDVLQAELLVEQIITSLEIVGGDIISATPFSGNVAVIQFALGNDCNTDIPEDPQDEDEDEDEDDGGSSTGSGCINPNGCGGNGNDDEEESEGEILGASTCTPYLTTFMQMGQPNLREDVVRLQTFLNEYMGENLVVDGVYGSETFEAVKRFQVQEFDEILKPWGITEPTGIARETTVRHINNIMCPDLDIAMPILYCATTGNLLYPDGTIVNPNPEYILYNGQPIIKTWVIGEDVNTQEGTEYQYEK